MKKLNLIAAVCLLTFSSCMSQEHKVMDRVDAEFSDKYLKLIHNPDSYKFIKDDIMEVTYVDYLLQTLKDDQHSLDVSIDSCRKLNSTYGFNSLVTKRALDRVHFIANKTHNDIVYASSLKDNHTLLKSVLYYKVKHVYLSTNRVGVLNVNELPFKYYPKNDSLVLDALRTITIE